MSLTMGSVPFGSRPGVCNADLAVPEHLLYFEDSPRRVRTMLSPYQGTARSWPVRLPNGAVAPELVWAHEDPLPDAGAVRGLRCFLTERVDPVVDGERQPAEPS